MKCPQERVMMALVSPPWATLYKPLPGLGLLMATLHEQDIPYRVQYFKLHQYARSV